MDDLITCPYCKGPKTHEIREKRLQIHKETLRKNRDPAVVKLRTCRFNAKHIFAKEEESEHYAICADRFMIVQDLVHQDDVNDEEIAKIDINASSMPYDGEMWDDSDTPIGNNYQFYHVPIERRFSGDDNSSTTTINLRQTSSSIDKKASSVVAFNSVAFDASQLHVSDLPLRVSEVTSNVAKSEWQKQKKKTKKTKTMIDEEQMKEGNVTLEEKKKEKNLERKILTNNNNNNNGNMKKQKPDAAATCCREKETNDEQGPKTEKYYRKKLKQIEVLEMKKQEGNFLNEEEEGKIVRKTFYLMELEVLKLTTKAENKTS